MKLYFLFLLLPFLYANASPESKSADKNICGKNNYKIQSRGIRTATIFNIEIYELKIFADAPSFSTRPVCYELTYFRGFDEEDVDKAWKFQFHESSEYSYAELKSDVKKLTSFFSNISGERSQSFELTADTTRVFENGIYKGEIPGKNFQKSFISIWTGKNPPTHSLQQQLYETMKD